MFVFLLLNIYVGIVFSVEWEKYEFQMWGGGLYFYIKFLSVWFVVVSLSCKWRDNIEDITAVGSGIKYHSLTAASLKTM